METPLKKNPLPAWVSKPAAFMLVVFLLGTAVYLPTLSYDFVWDDIIIIKNYPPVKTLSNAPSLLLATFPIHKRSYFYRPLTMISFSWDYFLFQGNPWGFHLTNLLLHGLNCALVAFLAFILFENALAALMAGAFFALHPVHPEAVAFISGRTDLLFTCFSLLTLIALFKKSEKFPLGGSMFLAPLFFLLGLLSKETALVLLVPIAIGLYQKSREKFTSLRSVWLSLLPLVLVVIPYLLLRFYVVESYLFRKVKFPTSPFFFFEFGLRYLAYLIFPPQQASYFLYLEKTPHIYPLDLRFWLLVGLFILVLAAVIYLVYRRRETAFFLTLLIIPCLPSLHYNLFYTNSIMMERYLYLPTVGLALLGAWGFLRIPDKAKKATLGVVILILVLYGGATLWRSSVWKNEGTYFEAMKKEYPSSAYVRLLLGVAYKHQNRWEDAAQEMMAAARLYPYESKYYSELGWVYLHQGATANASFAFNQALSLAPYDPWALEGMGLIYLETGDQKKALEHLDMALFADPGNQDFIKNKKIALNRIQTSPPKGP